MQKKFPLILSLGIMLLVVATVFTNVQKQRAVDHSKLPTKVEEFGPFQKWITNAKNHGIDVGADDFKLKEENEVYNTKWLKVYSTEEPGMQETFTKTLEDHMNLQHVVWSPSKRLFLDYRDSLRNGYSPDQVRLYGQKEDKILDARILSCNSAANCYFDRAYFLDNDVFVISELSRTIERDDQNVTPCTIDQVCNYSFKEHVIDLINNKRLIYESKPFDISLVEAKSWL